LIIANSAYAHFGCVHHMNNTCYRSRGIPVKSAGRSMAQCIDCTADGAGRDACQVVVNPSTAFGAMHCRPFSTLLTPKRTMHRSVSGLFFSWRLWMMDILVAMLVNLPLKFIHHYQRSVDVSELTPQSSRQRQSQVSIAFRPRTS
jgi:hypothetical protein